MAQDKDIQEMRKSLLLLQEEVERLSSPPYIPGTVLDITDKATRVSVDKGEIFEIPPPSDSKLLGKIKRGSRIIVNPSSKAIIGFSEFKCPGGEIVTVDEVLDGTLRVQNKGEHYLVLSSLEGITPGDEVMLDPSNTLAVESFQKKKTKYALERIQEAPWSNIGGLEKTIGTIRQEVEEPFLHREIFEKYGRKPAKGILLYGPPGCGKTMVAKSIAYSLAQSFSEGKTSVDGHFIKIDGPEILDKWVGNSEATIRRIYEAARETASESASPVIVFIDEAESVLKTRGTGISTDVYDSIVPQFLAEMDGLNGSYNVITVLATNREDMIDSAILRDGRVDKRIKVPRPDLHGASEIFHIYLKGKPLERRMFGLTGTNAKDASEKLAGIIFDDNNLAYAVVSPTQGVLGSFHYRHLLSGAMIKGIVDRASTYSIQREIKGDKSGISQADLERAIDEEFVEHAGFTQALVRSDWEDVFGSQGRQYEQSCRQGYLVLESLIKPSYDQSTKLKEVK